MPELVVPATPDPIAVAVGQLHRAGWTVGQFATSSEAGELVWVVTGSNGENLLVGDGGGGRSDVDLLWPEPRHQPIMEPPWLRPREARAELAARRSRLLKHGGRSPAESICSS